MKHRSPRLAVRAILMHQDRLLLVNAYPGTRSDLWCAPGGGVEPGTSLPDNLRREVHEECGIEVAVGPLALVNEFHDPRSGFHQVDLFFRCSFAGGELPTNWRDPEGVVARRRFFGRRELAGIRLKPDSLAAIAFAGSAQAHYDPLEEIVP
ncbi:NUDIX domain-containing protein [Frigidibacter sp. RF13]|uniref:NUDIX domain-containing protein n=1 Tax=Frigidibacter sp. RF13 TaxID=2997340 RepID=UPI002270B1CA|nr:NUDIX domain-containing protein [Frigidibacter sp. RF13]MCY1127153.1 NUDIX domain-containing protein [Frigidibacter sp. RF13]